MGRRARASRFPPPHAMDRLDVATALAIRERLGARDLARSSAVCREFNALANDDTLWRGLSSRETHALVDADELPAPSGSGDDASRAKRLYLCNRGWVDGEVHRDGSCFTRDEPFVEAAFAQPSDGASPSPEATPGSPRSRSDGCANANARAMRRRFALRAVHATGAVLDRPDETERASREETKSVASGERRFRRRATCATFLDPRDPDVAVSGFADGTLRASCVALGKRRVSLAFAQRCGGRARALAALEGAFEMEGEDARALVVSVDELSRSSAGARGVLLTARVPSALPRASDDDADEDGVGVGDHAFGTRTVGAVPPLPVSFGGWCATRDASTCLRFEAKTRRLFAGTAGGSVEAFDLGSGQPRCVASFVGQCACPVGDVATCGPGRGLVVATFAHENRGTGHARGCLAFDVRGGGRVAAVDPPRRYGTLGRAGSSPGGGVFQSGLTTEPACALHADANKVVLGSPDGFAHVVDPRTWTETACFAIAGGERGELLPAGSVSLLRARGERVAAQIDTPDLFSGRLVTLRVGASLW